MSFLRPVPMVKVGLVGLKDDREAILSVLHDLGVVQIEPLDKETLRYFEPEHGGESQRKVSDQLLRFRGLKAALPAVPVREPRAFENLDDVFRTAERVPVDDEVGALKREEDRLQTERRSVNDTLDLLHRFSFYTDRLEYLTAKSVLAFFGETDADRYDRLRRDIPQLSESGFVSAPAEERRVRFLVAVRADRADTVARLAQQAGVTLVAAPRLEGTPSEAIPRLETRRGEIDRRLGEIRGRLDAIAREWYPTIVALEEAFGIENRKLEAWTRMGSGRTTFALEGWVPRRSRAPLERTLLEVSHGRVLLYDVAARGPAPTLMDNPPGVRVFEFFIRFYSLPQANEWDPTWIFALAFPIFFGLMLGDWGYGLTILGISLWMIAGFPGGQHLPKSLRNFVKLIMSPRGMQSLARTIVPGCALAIALGLLFDQFFGFHIFSSNLHLIAHPVFDPISGTGVSGGAGVTLLLKVAGYIGLIMVSAGFLLGGLKEYFHGHYRGAVARFGGIFFAWGIALVGLSLLHSGTPGVSPSATPIVAWYYAILAVGVVMLVIGERGQGLMALTEILSHILSYTRLVGILLSSVVLALVIDTIFWTNAGTFNVGHLILGLIVLVIGQGFNVVLGVFEPGIQGARLIFVEHFSKFYTGNGRPFHPFGSRRTHTVARSPRRPLITDAGVTVPTESPATA
jgi:V/A-type H+-transporting ATPase subunit I